MHPDIGPNTPFSSDPAALERQLVDRLLTRDPIAWQCFVSEYGRIIRSRVADVARSFGFATDGSAIDDATADIFGSIVANDVAALRAFAGRSSLKTYLAVISTRCATRTFARKRLLIRTQSTSDVSQIHGRSEQDPGHRVALAEERERIRDLMEALPFKQREVVRLFHFEGESYAAISHALNIPIGSVGVTLQRAEAKLRSQLEPPK